MALPFHVLFSSSITAVYSKGSLSYMKIGNNNRYIYLTMTIESDALFETLERKKKWLKIKTNGNHSTEYMEDMINLFIFK